MAKYGKILNICIPDYMDAFITDEQGNFVCTLEQYQDDFKLRDIYGVINLKIDMESGVVNNWKELSKEQIVDLIEKFSEGN